jgi:replicative DNA helicase
VRLSYGESLLSKIVDANDSGALLRFGIEESHFLTEVERKAYRFIKEYSEQNRGQAPSYVTLAQEVEGFTYIPQIGDSYEYLTAQLKDKAGKKQFYDLLMGESVGKNYQEFNTEAFADWLIKEAERIKIGIRTHDRIGTNIKEDTSKFLEEYHKRKEGKSFKLWASKFPTVNREVGEYISGNMYTWFGRSGRGKSVFVMEEALESAMQGANVLVWALEMSYFEWLSRAYSSLSAREGILTANIDGVDYEAGFESRALIKGQLPEDFEAGLETFLSTLNETISGNITVRAVDDTDFTARNLKQLEADIIQTNADVVVLDPIYYIEMEANTSKTAGGDVSATSKKLRQIAGRTSTVMHVITQADEVKDDRSEDGERELRPPRRSEVKKTKAVLEDAVNLFGIDTLDGRGIIEIGKGRHGGEGITVEVTYLPNYGIVKEIPTGEVAAAQFF